ncbi:hypothetical protein DPEC_G00288970 [Dallia pectoralis]|uniref:Uncharacterized protein n=1 Tax=Dallia pectoralis TaxID=75939 RepID=A0ACC2FKP6_DALPE|nr:hypothetical protein DPEC_G00288970 [Dallia pectoralis]
MGGMPVIGVGWGGFQFQLPGSTWRRWENCSCRESNRVIYRHLRLNHSHWLFGRLWLLGYVHNYISRSAKTISKIRRHLTET